MPRDCVYLVTGLPIVRIRSRRIRHRARACQTMRDKYVDANLGGARLICAKISDARDLYLVDSAFESFIQHINNVADYGDEDRWEISIHLKMIHVPSFPGFEDN